MIDIVEKEVTYKEKKCKRPAHFKYEDTGRKEVVKEIDDKGKEQHIEKPIKNKVFQDALYEELEKKKKVYEVAVDGEKHVFSTRADALAFKRDYNRRS